MYVIVPFLRAQKERDRWERLAVTAPTAAERRRAKAKATNCHQEMKGYANQATAYRMTEDRRLRGVKWGGGHRAARRAT